MAQLYHDTPLWHLLRNPWEFVIFAVTGNQVGGHVSGGGSWYCTGGAPYRQDPPPWTSKVGIREISLEIIVSFLVVNLHWSAWLTLKRMVPTRKVYAVAIGGSWWAQQANTQNMIKTVLRTLRLWRWFGVILKLLTCRARDLNRMSWQFITPLSNVFARSNRPHHDWRKCDLVLHDSYSPIFFV